MQTPPEYIARFSHIQDPNRREDAYVRGRWKHIRTGGGEEFLFDLERDPIEQVNRTDDGAKPRELKEGYLRVKGALPAGTPR